MKKLALVWILVLILGLGVAWAEVPVPTPVVPQLPPLATPPPDSEISTILNNIFGATPSSDESSKYSVATSVPYKVGDNEYYYCNSDPTITVNVSALVKQWVYVSLSATRIDWTVYKPGTYSVDGITGIVASNGMVKITFSGFENLKNWSWDLGDWTQDQILVWYAKQQIYPPPFCSTTTWVTAEDLNRTSDYVPENEGNHLYIWKLWNAIGVSLCDSAGYYADKDGATITVNLIESCSSWPSWPYPWL
ncbi:MAG: hypothetical protein PWP57_903 [Candidatus Atribacteria bacterium]|nr:hypothetical protein [Candidatus Atribacteria bacterium]